MHTSCGKILQSWHEHSGFQDLILFLKPLRDAVFLIFTEIAFQWWWCYSKWIPLILLTLSNKSQKTARFHHIRHENDFGRTPRTLRALLLFPFLKCYDVKVVMLRNFGYNETLIFFYFRLLTFDLLAHASAKRELFARYPSSHLLRQPHRTQNTQFY